MRVNRRRFVRAATVGTIGGLAARRIAAAAAGDAQHFELVQPETFAVSGGQPSCWADFNGDGFYDLFVGFKEGVANRLYRYDGQTFVNVADDLGLADTTDTRAAAWGDFADDRQLSLYVGYTRRSNQANRLYRYDGKRFVDVAHDLGVDVKGETRQVSWIDFDNDGRLDLFVAFRDAPNMLFHNDGNKFVNVDDDMGVDDRRKTGGSVW